MLFSYYFIFDRIKCVLVQWLFRKEDTLWCLSQRAYISLTCISGHICICYSSETNLTCFQWWCVSNWHSADILTFLSVLFPKEPVLPHFYTEKRVQNTTLQNIFDELWAVWKCGETCSLVFDISSQSKPNPRRKWIK